MRYRRRHYKPDGLGAAAGSNAVAAGSQWSGRDVVGIHRAPYVFWCQHAVIRIHERVRQKRRTTAADTRPNADGEHLRLGLYMVVRPQTDGSADSNVLLSPILDKLFLCVINACVHGGHDTDAGSLCDG